VLLRFRSLIAVFVGALLALGAVPSFTASAGAATTVTLTKDVTVAAPPSSSFAGASSGDGWDVAFYQDRVFNVFHHSAQYQIDCHLQTDGSHCDTVGGISPWPKTASDPDLGDFTSPAHASGWVDQAAGKFYGWTSRESDSTAGIICVDLTTPAADPFCGFTPLGTPGGNPETDTTTVGGRAVVGTELLGYDPETQQVLCFSTVTDAACTGQPFAIDIGGISPITTGWSDNSTLAAAGKLFVHAEDNNNGGGVLTCFDPVAQTVCSGNWPQVISDSVSAPSANVGAPFPYLAASGTATGVCMPYDGVDPCWDLAGTPISTPAALVAAIGSTDLWNEGTVLGSRVFMPTGQADSGGDAVYCYDFAAGAGCPNFPIQTDGSTYAYSVTPDPVREGCMWINSDHSDGTYSQIRTFDGYDGTLGCSDRVHVTSGVVIPDSGCTALGWTQMQILDPSRADYASATVSLVGADGSPVPGATDVALDSQGRIDLSGLTIPDSVIFTTDFTNPTFSGNGVIVQFTWQSTNASTCQNNATRVPASPTISSVTPDSAHGGLSVAFTPPIDPGTSPITSYRYSTDGGVTWQDRTDSGSASSPMLITSTSTDGTALVDGSTYAVIVRAVSDVGTGLASNQLDANAVVPELLSAPAAMAVQPGSSAYVTPVYVAGYTNDVTIDLTTSIGTISVVSNGGLTTGCSPCTGTEVTFTGPQDAVNVALATLNVTAPGGIGTGHVQIALTKNGDSTPSQNASIVVNVQAPTLARPTLPTLHAASTSALTATFTPVAHASSYTLRLYNASGTTLIGSPRPNFVSGAAVTGLSPSTSYVASITAIGDGTNYLDSPEGPKGSGTTLAAPGTPCAAVPRPAQGLPTGHGPLYAVDGTGHLATVPTFTGAHHYPVIGGSATASGLGSWLLSSEGGVLTAGDAPFAGSLSSRTLKASVTSISGTRCGRGYDILATDGGIFSFGDAPYLGSMGGTKLNQPMSGMAITCSGHGYYTVANDGGVFSFGDARFHGSMAGLNLASPIFAITPNCSNTGYWTVAKDGGVFTSGAVGFYGSLGGHKLNSPIVGLIPTPTFHGYWLIDANGATYPFGDATA
jgi:hypothetical protein